MKKGAFFGARSLLERTTFHANYVVTSKAQLLVLDAADFHHLLDHYPDLKERIENTYSGNLEHDFGQAEVEELEEE